LQLTCTGLLLRSAVFHIPFKECLLGANIVRIFSSLTARLLSFDVAGFYHIEIVLSWMQFALRFRCLAWWFLLFYSSERGLKPPLDGRFVGLFFLQLNTPTGLLYQQAIFRGPQASPPIVFLLDSLPGDFFVHHI